MRRSSSEPPRGKSARLSLSLSLPSSPQFSRYWEGAWSAKAYKRGRRGGKIGLIKKSNEYSLLKGASVNFREKYTKYIVHKTPRETGGDNAFPFSAPISPHSFYFCGTSGGNKPLTIPTESISSGYIIALHQNSHFVCSS